MDPVSLEELVKVYKVPVDSLGKSCSDEHLTSVSIFFDWRATAPHLGLKEEEIDAIECNSKKEEERRHKVLLKWRAKYDFRATYEKLISVLLELGRADHAGKVCQLLAPETGAQPESTASNTMEGAGPSSVSATPLSSLPGTLPSLQQCDARQLEEEIHELEELFLDVVAKAESSLDNAPVDLRKLKRYIIQLPVSVKYQYIKIFAGNLSAIRKAESIEEIFDILAPYWDFMNCSLLEVIVKKFGDEGTKADMEKYLQKLKEFRCCTKVRDYIEKWTHGWPPHFASLTVEVKEEWMDRTLKDLEEFRMEISRKISFETYALSLKEAESGSLRLCFALQRSFPVRAVILQALKELLQNEDVLMILFQGVSIKEIEDPYWRSDCLYETQGGSTAVKKTGHPEDADVQRDSEEEVEGTPEAPPTGGSEEDGATATRLRGKLLATKSLLEMERKAKEELQQQLVESELKLEEADLLNKQLCSERDELTAALEQREAKMEGERKEKEGLQEKLKEKEGLQEKLKEKESAGLQVHSVEVEGERREVLRRVTALIKKGELLQLLAEAMRMPDPEKCRAVGPGVESAETDKVTHFQVHLAEPGGDPCTSVQEVKAELRSLVNGSVTPATVVCKTPDTYEASYQPSIRGRHELSVVVNGTPIQGSPFRVYVRHPPHLLGKPVRIISGLGDPGRVATTSKGEIIVTEMDRFSFLRKSGQRLKSIDSALVGVSGQEHSLNPAGVAVDGEGSIYVTDSATDRLFKFSSEGRMLKSVGGEGENAGQFNFPDGIAIRNKNVYVCDRNNCRIQVFNTNLSFISSFGTRGSGEGQFKNPTDVAFDSTGNLYVTDKYNDRIQVFSPSGTFLRRFGSYGEGPGQLSYSEGIHVDHDYVYVVEWGNNRVSIFNTSGRFISSFGKWGTREGELRGPCEVTIDHDGFVYVCDSYNDRIQVF